MTCNELQPHERAACPTMQMLVDCSSKNLAMKKEVFLLVLKHTAYFTTSKPIEFLQKCLIALEMRKTFLIPMNYMLKKHYNK